LLFMLAATTASIVVFRWIWQENFSSGARLKASEAYQASQAGLEATQGWLANKGADAGALIRVFEIEAGKPVLLNDFGGQAVDLLAGGSFKDNSKRNQGFEVYLTGVNTEKQPYKFKFLSIGTARDGSRHSQVGIFEVDGLYKMGLPTPPGNKAQKVPPFFGGFGGGTQGTWTGAHVIGDMTTESGFASKEDAIITGSATIKGDAASNIGCPNNEKPKDGVSPPSNYEAADYGNFYVRENFSPGGGIGFCGSVYVGGKMEMTQEIRIVIWGDLYVEGDLIINGELIVHGNVTVKGNITKNDVRDLEIKGNFVMPNSSSTISISGNNKLNIGGDVWIAGNLAISSNNLTFCQVNTNKLYMTGVTQAPNENNTICVQNTRRFISNCNGGCTGTGNPLSPPNTIPTGANELSYLGNQITTEKVGGKYIIPDPIVLGFFDEWNTKSIPTSAACATLKNFADASGVINLGNVGDNNISNGTFMKAINDCYNSGGNWNSTANSSNWLVLKVNWPQINNFQNNIFDGNFIIIVENKPNQMILPRTTTSTNVLLYLKQGATTIQIPKEEGYARNYFIYSGADIDRVDGNQGLKGNIFMANGTKVGTMQDPTIQINDALFEALSEAGVIQDNPNRCRGTGNADENGNCKEDGTTTPINPPITNPENDPSLVYVPTIPHLKVVLQSQYANEEDPGDFANAEPAILVMPRIVYAQPGEMADIDKLLERFNVLYLNGAYQGSNKPSQADIKSALQTNCYGFINNSGRFICTVNLKKTNCNSNLCINSFYIDIATTGTSSGAASSSSLGNGGGGNSAGIASSSSAVPSSSSVTVNAVLECAINSKVKAGTSIFNASGVTVNCNSNGTITSATINNYTGVGSNPSNLTAGTYSNIGVTATCGGTQVTGSCTGTLTVVGLTCTGLVAGGYAKPDASIIQPNLTQPTLSCSQGTASAINWTRTPTFTGWTIPSSASAGTSYSISATATCDGLSGLTADCGTVKVAGITCTDLPSNVIPGGTIPVPTLTCNNGSSASSRSYKNGQSTISLPYSVNSGTAVGTKYIIEATATCGTITGLTANCGTVTVQNLPLCQFQQSWCPNVDWANGIQWGQSFRDEQGKCFFFNGNGNTAPSCNGGSCLIYPGDNGYYVYVSSTPTHGISNDNGARAKPTTCIGPVCSPVALSCENQTIAAGGTPSNSKLNCSCGLALGNINWSTFDNNSAGVKNVTVNATCGTTSVSKTCQVEVQAAGGGDVNIIGKNDPKTITAGGTITMQCNDACSNSGALLCCVDRDQSSSAYNFSINDNSSNIPKDNGRCDNYTAVISGVTNNTYKINNTGSSLMKCKFDY